MFCFGKICNPIAPINTIQEFIQIFTRCAEDRHSILALAIIYCGFLCASSRQPDELTKAKDTLLYTLIGDDTPRVVGYRYPYFRNSACALNNYQLNIKNHEKN